MILGIFCALSPIITTNLCLKYSEFSMGINLDKEHVKISQVSGKIHIINNSGWVDFRNAGNCTGSGDFPDPYLIEDLIIDGGGSGSCILIENSNVHFKIENCTLYNSGYPNAGIKLINVTRGYLIKNNCTANYNGIELSSCEDMNRFVENTANYNYNGIKLSSCVNNYFLGNTANYNYNGIELSSSDSNIFSINTANNNTYGIHLYSSDLNTIDQNTAIYNTNYGIFLEESNYNYFLDNILRDNGESIREENCVGNIFSDYSGCSNGLINPIWGLLLLFGVLSAVAILVGKKLKNPKI